MTPADVAKVLGVAEGDVLTIIESGELAAKKIGSSYRIKRSALDEYLASRARLPTPNSNLQNDLLGSWELASRVDA